MAARIPCASDKDGRILCLTCGAKVDGMFGDGHDLACPMGEGSGLRGGTPSFMGTVRAHPCPRMTRCNQSVVQQWRW